MIEKILFILAALATIAGFALDAWKEWRSRKDDVESKKKGW